LQFRPQNLLLALAPALLVPVAEASNTLHHADQGLEWFSAPHNISAKTRRCLSGDSGPEGFLLSFFYLRRFVEFCFFFQALPAHRISL